MSTIAFRLENKRQSSHGILLKLPENVLSKLQRILREPDPMKWQLLALLTRKPLPFDHLKGNLWQLQISELEKMLKLFGQPPKEYDPETANLEEIKMEHIKTLMAYLKTLPESKPTTDASSRLNKILKRPHPIKWQILAVFNDRSLSFDDLKGKLWPLYTSQLQTMLELFGQPKVEYDPNKDNLDQIKLKHIIALIAYLKTIPELKRKFVNVNLGIPDSD